MRSSRFRHVGSAAVLALAASGGVTLVTAAGPAAAVTPHDTPAPVPSNGYTLSIAVATSSITPGQTDVVTGVLDKVGAPQVGDTIILRARPEGRFFGHRVASAVTDNAGSVQFTVKPDRSTHYRLVFRVPTATTTPVASTTAVPSTVMARSKVVMVHVVRPSSLSIRSRQRHGTGREIIEGQLRGGGHPLAHRKVMLQEQTLGSVTWTTVATRTTHRDGVVEFFAPKSQTAEEFQLVFAGGPNYSGSQSGVVTVNVV